MTDRPIVEAHALVKTYHKGSTVIRPIDGLDLAVPEGQLLALMGPSGSGKSTLLNLLGGLDRPDQGSCRVGDVEVSAMSEAALCDFRAANVGFVFQSFNLVPVLTARENVELPLRLLAISGPERRQQVDAALRVVGLAERADHLPGELSGGEEQRVAIARAIATDPRVIIADEPTGDLDEDSGDLVLDVLRALSSDHGKTVIMVTHDPRMAERADRVLYFDKGRLTDTPARGRSRRAAPPSDPGESEEPA